MLREQDVAEVAQAEEPAADDPVEHLLDQLAMGDGLGQVVRQDARGAERPVDQRAEAVADRHLGAADRPVDQVGEPGAVGAGDPRARRRREALSRWFDIRTSRRWGSGRLIGRRPHDAAQTTRSTVKTSRSWSRQTVWRS